ncbi:uncharacterized protein LOC144436648 [Glandiceps talaboti]
MFKVEELYNVGGSEKIKSVEEELSRELKELKVDIEENEMLSGAPRVTSSLALPRDLEHFRQERKHVIERGLQVYEAHPLIVQADVLTEEAEISMKPEYTDKSLPLILHQYFCNRIQQLVHCKHMHMLRWKRFCSHTSSLEAMYPFYHKRLALIMSEYNDALARAKRLSVAKDDLTSNKSPVGPAVISAQDLQIYTRWLTCHLHSIKKIHSYLKILEWLPVSHKYDIMPTPSDDVKEDILQPEPPADTARSVYTSRSDTKRLSHTDTLFSRSSRPGSAASGLTAPLPGSINLLSTTAVSSALVGAGGMVSNEATQGIPLHVTDLEHLKPLLEFLMSCYGVQMDITQIVTTADEMELVANVNRRFRTYFAKQEQQKTFPTYDKIELGLEMWGTDSPSKALKKESNWLSFIKIKPERDPQQEKMLTKLRQKNNIDLLLQAQSRFLTVTDSTKVQDALKQHAIAVRDPPTTQPISVTSHKAASNTSSIWRKIYLNSDLYSGHAKEDDLTVVEFDEKDTDNVNFSGRTSRAGSRSGSATGRRRNNSDEYNYFNAMQMLGLDDDDESHQDPTMIQGGYLSFLTLRHLRVRDLQRSCLSILNYFRSVERTLTINDGGLSLESGKQKRTSQNHRVGVREGGQDGGGGLGSHHYLHYTPADYKVSETEFMEFSEVENHDDFYTLEEGKVHVQDQRGYYVIYDAALKDLEDLEKDLLLIATHFIEKDKENRCVDGVAGMRRADSARKRQSLPAGDVDMPMYGHQQVDRFAILLDLWTNEAAYLENKRQLLDCYVEAYHNVFDMQEKRQLTQVITNIIYKRPRFDFDAAYFVKTYRAESVCLRLHCSLVKSMLDKQIDDQREYIQKVTRDGDTEFGLPHQIVPKQLVALNLSRPALKHVYMLEFHPSLALASRLPVCLSTAFFDLYYTHQPKSVTEAIGLEKKLLELAHKEWDTLQVMGNSFSLQVQKDIFADVFAEDPLFMCEIGESVFKSRETSGGKLSKKEKQTELLNIWCRLLDTVTQRHRLIDAAWETEILSNLYKRHAFEMGFEEFHLYLRYVQFEFASFKENADQPPPVFITALQEDDSSIDRYVPSSLYLAIQELDEKNVGMFTFRNRDGFIRMVEGNGLDNLRTAVQCQVVQKNALLSAVQQADACSYFQEVSAPSDSTKSGRKSPSDSRSEKSSLTAMTTSMASGPVNVQSMASSVVFAAKLKTGMERHKRSPESFVSLQLEKVPSRDMMLNEYLTKKQSMGTLMKSNDEVEKLKRSLISKFCLRFQRRISQYSLRGQIIAYLNSTVTLLEEFPTTRRTHFLFGLPNEKKTDKDDKKGLETDPRTIHKRPKRILSSDGTTLLNLWFVPHHSEVLIMFKTLDNDTCIRALRLTLQLVAAVHDILHYLCAYSKLGSSHARMGSKRMEFVTADWGGTEGISGELLEIQRQIDNLEDPTNPQEVCDYLTLRRDVMFLEFDTSVRHAMCDTYLSTRNVKAYQSVTDNMHFALANLSNVQVPTVYSSHLPVPEPLEARDLSAQQLVPWRAFLGRRGPFPTQFWEFRKIEYNMQLCLAGLKDVDRHVANGEILGVSLLMEDVLQTCQPDELYNMDCESDDESSTDKGNAKTKTEEKIPEERESIHSFAVVERKPISRSKEPIVAFGLLKKFLILWKVLEVFKKDWAKRKLGAEEISTPTLYKQYCKLYKVEILYPVLKSMARKYGKGDLYEGMINEDEPMIAPAGASEMEVRAKQLIRLLDSLEAHMVYELRRKIAKEHTLVVSEKAREEGNLPTDLWKKPVMNERMTIAKPHIAEDFSRLLMSEAKSSEDEIIIKRETLNKSLSLLANMVMQRERSNFESYSMYYENLLRHHHQLLYQREQEIKQLKETSKNGNSSAFVEVQCQLADRSHELILEITSLRAKIAEMREQALTMERDVRESVKDEYNGLVQNLFSTSFTLKSRFDEFRKQLYDDMFTSVGDVRREAVDTMSKLKSQPGGMEEADTLQRNLRKAEELRQIRHENNSLNRLVMKMRTMNNWKRTHLKEYYENAVYNLRQEADRCKKDYLEITMMADEEVILLRQQLVALKKALANSEREREGIQKQQEKEMKLKKELEHKAVQEARSAKQLEQARASNLEKLVEQLEDKDVRLKVMSYEQEKNLKMNHITQSKTKKDIDQMKKQLHHERSMKLDAFQRVDELQTQVYDYETDFSQFLPSRPHTAGTMRSVKSRDRVSRASTGVWPPPTGYPPNFNRSLTPDPWPKEPSDSDRIIQRPKTVSGRLRTKITDQLLHDVQPDRHETIMQLQELDKMTKLTQK